MSDCDDLNNSFSQLSVSVAADANKTAVVDALLKSVKKVTCYKSFLPKSKLKHVPPLHLTPCRDKIYCQNSEVLDLVTQHDLGGGHKTGGFSNNSILMRRCGGPNLWRTGHEYFSQ